MVFAAQICRTAYSILCGIIFWHQVIVAVANNNWNQKWAPKHLGKK